MYSKEVPIPVVMALLLAGSNLVCTPDECWRTNRGMEWGGQEQAAFLPDEIVKAQ